MVHKESWKESTEWEIKQADKGFTIQLGKDDNYDQKGWYLSYTKEDEKYRLVLSRTAETTWDIEAEGENYFIKEAVTG
jgi:hypothetical protein